MSDQNRQENKQAPTPSEPSSVDEIEISPLTDEALEDVAGGSGGCSCVGCSSAD